MGPLAFKPYVKQGAISHRDMVSPFVTEVDNPQRTRYADTGQYFDLHAQVPTRHQLSPANQALRALNVLA